VTVTKAIDTRIVRRSDPVLLILRPMLGIIAAAFSVSGTPSVVRAVLVGVFVLVVPGWSLLEVWELTHGWLGVALVVATSVALASAVATAMLYLGMWSATLALLVLVGITVVIDLFRAIVQVVRSGLRRSRARAGR
jgi:hypothetical protein